MNNSGKDQSSYSVYFISTISEKHGDFLKIGVTSDIDRRMKEIQTGCPLPLKLECIIPTSSKSAAYLLESQLHNKFNQFMTCGEWFVKGDVYRNIDMKNIIKQTNKRQPDQQKRSSLVRARNRNTELRIDAKKKNKKMAKVNDYNSRLKKENAYLRDQFVDHEDEIERLTQELLATNALINQG